MFPRSGPNQKQALHTSGKNGKQVFIWNQPPAMFCLQPGGQAKDVEPLPIMAWERTQL